MIDSERRKQQRLQQILQRLLDRPGVSIDIRNYTHTLTQATEVMRQVTDMLKLMDISYQERHGTHELCVLSGRQLKILADMKKDGIYGPRKWLI